MTNLTVKTPKDMTVMQTFGVIFAGFATLLFMIFLTPILGMLAGAFVGWIISWVAPVWVPTGLGFIGIKVGPDQMVELGSALGFIGGFFRIHLPSKDKK